jgi:uncharacterized protein YkwD
MKDIRIYILYFAFIMLLGSCKKDSEDLKPYDMEILDAVNAYRAGLGLAPLENNDFMWEQAREHSQATADGTIPFGHDGSTERYANIRLELGNGNYAENIDWGNGTATEVVDRWLESVGHKGNIEGNFKYTAISAIRTTDNKFYYTQLFYKPD